MKNIRYFAQKYIDWVIKLGRLKFSLLGFIILAILALCTHILLSSIIVGEIHWQSLIYSISFGLISAPFVIYFFTLLVEKLELSRLSLSKSVAKLRQEIQERIIAEQRLAQANQDKTTLMATISHELRTPLNGIVGLSRMLLETNLTDEQRNYLKTINFSAVSLGHIFNDIIDLDKIDAKRIELYQQQTDFHALIDNIANIGQFMATQKKLTFHLKCGQNLPHFLMLDETRLSQILWNLLSNAVKFTGQGEIILDIQRVSQNQYQFSVTDSGQGIPESDIENIFEMYYQVEKSQHKPAGSGIGLAISKTIAKLMNGSLTVTTQLGKGSTFTLLIQAEEIQVSLNKNTLDSVELDLNVLLVEDIELNIVVAKSVLEKLGCHVDVAMTGKLAIEQFDSKSYDLVFLDIQLPDMTGFAIAQYLRQRYEDGVYSYRPPLIALTANVMQSKSDYLVQGMDDVLAKPLDVNALTHCLNQYFPDYFDSHSLEFPQSAVNFSHEFDREPEIVDYQFVRELVDLISVQTYLSNLATFRTAICNNDLDLHKKYNAYLNNLISQSELISTAHKLKGAAGSLGLKAIQKLAACIQNPDLPDWADQLNVWMTELDNIETPSISALDSWLTEFNQYLHKKGQ